MPPRSGDPGSAPERRFFLAGAPESGTAELLPQEIEHALRVLRLAPGDRLTGLDGRGGAWPVRVERVERGRIELALDGPPLHAPRAGEAGAALPWIEVAVAWPKPARADEMLDRLTQLGVSSIQPIVADRSAPGARELSPNRAERLSRIAREACKQSGRTWLPEIREPRTVEELARVPSRDTVLLGPDAPTSLSDWAHERRSIEPRPWTAELPLRAIAGPEGGFAPSEIAALLERGASTARLGPNVLRIETAAEAALAILVDVLFRPSRS